MRPRLLVILVLAAPLAGCINDAYERDERSTIGPDVSPMAFDEPHGLSGCEESLSVLSVDAARAQAELPGGYRARAVESLFGQTLLVPSGQVVAVVGLFMCEGSSAAAGPFTWASMALMVDPPEFPNVTSTDWANLYELDAWSSSSAHRDLYTGGERPVEPGHVTIAHRSDGHTRSARLLDADNATRYETLTVHPNTEDGGGNIRAWRESANGTSWIDYTYTSVDETGTALSCHVARGTALSRIIDGVDCTPHVLLAVWHISDFTGVFQWRPGTYAAP